ncbi:MAG: DoxX family protein [Nocardioides sp.]|uniref:DoxX family protein n=1 Tax=Nocardioides sp. TaxID=35761 RepID=UPI003D6B2245
MEPVDLALLILRVALGATLVAHGVNHWRGGGKIAGTAGWFESLGLRQPKLQAWASVVTEIGAGVLLILGLITPLAAAGLVGVMLVAMILAHRGNGFFIFNSGWEYVMVLIVAGGVLGVTGPGVISLDSAIGIVYDGWIGGAVALGAGVLGAALLLAAFWRPGKPAAAEAAVAEEPVEDASPEDVTAASEKD